jgi:hypothetical protein
MKKVQILFLMGILSLLRLTAYSQQTASWKEMEDFHVVMSTTFHPAEEDNLQPLKEKAGDLVSRAKAWEKSAAPGGFNGSVTKPILKRLVQQCKVIKEAVGKDKTDAELKLMISEAHEIFHEIKEKCKKSDH